MKRNTCLYIGLPIFLAFLLFSCGAGGRKKYEQMGDNGKTMRTEAMQENLRTWHQKGVIFGQMYSTLCGVGWQNDSLRSDIHSVCGDFAACTGYELSDIRSGNDNMDVPLSRIREDVLNMSRCGGLPVIRWMMPEPADEQEQNDIVKAMADFLNSLEDGYGKKAPVVVCLLPRCTDEWYSALQGEEYKRLFANVKRGLENNGVVNAVWGYAFEDTEDAAMGMACCPDDEVSIVDVTAVPADTPEQITKCWQRLNSVLQDMLPIAESRRLALGVTVGDYMQKDSTYWSKTVLPVITSNHLCYALFRENSGVGTSFIAACPYPGSEDVNDFMLLFNDKRTIFAHNLNGLYLSS